MTGNVAVNVGPTSETPLVQRQHEHRWPNGSMIGWANGAPTSKKYRWPNSNMIRRANGGPTAGWRNGGL